MKEYLIKRSILAVGVIFTIAAVTFFVLNIVPGDPVRIMVGDMVDEATIERIREQLGLNKPIIEQFFAWLGNMLTGDFGTSYVQRKSVTLLMAQALKTTVVLSAVAYLYALVFGIIIGVMAAVWRGRLLDRALMSLSVLGISAPVFWVAVLLQIVFALTLKWFPLAGVRSWQAFVLPALVLGVRYAASIARVTRTSMLDVLSQDFMRTAEAKGIKKWVIILKHGLRNALIPIITIAGTQLGDIFTGSILIETIFAMPGIGKLLLDAINARDLPLIQGSVMYIACICVVVYLLVDILYAVVDPRIRFGSQKEGV